jgi:hypothetical protein
MNEFFVDLDVKFSESGVAPLLDYALPGLLAEPGKVGSP